MPRIMHPSRRLRKKKFRRARRRPGRRRILRLEEAIDYKNIGLLRPFLNIRWSLKPRRQSRLTRRDHARVALAVKQARSLGLLPYTHLHSAYGMNPGGKR